MKGYIKALDNCNIILKVILALPVLDGLIYGIYRICKGVVKKDAFKVILGIIWIFLGVAVIGALIDLFSIFTRGKVDILA